jgi:glycosyltransferase involved in cell wall biosynthesis
MRNHILFIVENNSVPRDVRVWGEALAAKEFGYDVSVICPRDVTFDNRGNYIDGIRIYTHPLLLEGNGKISLILEYANALFWEFLLSLRVFIQNKFNILHGANPPDHVFLIALFFKVFGVKFIFDHHDIAPENYIAKFGKRGFFYSALLIMERLTFKTADLVISTNESYKKVAMERGRIKENNIFVVRNGPNLSRIRVGKPNQKLRDGFKYLVGYVGIIAQQEGIENLLHVIDYIVNVKKRNDIKFIIVGRGPHLEAVIKMSQDLKLEKYAWFTGYISDKALYEILSTVDVCVNPEFTNEFTNRSTMIKIMEYMTFAKPIVQHFTTEGEVTAGGAAIYINKNSEIEFAEALLQLLEDPSQRERMGREGRRRIEDFLNWDRQKIRLREAYKQLEIENGQRL